MNHLIWDLDVMQGMVSQLRNASRQLQDCTDDIKALRAAGEEIFKENNGVSRRILDQLDVLTRRTEQVEEEDSNLASALTRSIDLFASLEASLQKEADVVLSDAKAAPVCRPEYPHAIWHLPFTVIVIPQSVFTLDFVPDWLSEAADKAFGLR